MLRGRISVSMELDGAHQRVGDFMVPPAVVVNLVGEHGEPDASLRFEAREGAIVCTRFSATGAPGGRGLRTSDLATLNVDAIGEDAFLGFATPVHVSPAPLGPSEDREEWAMRRAIGAAQRVAPGPSRAELEEVARLYRSVPTAPVAAIENAFGYSRRTASRRVKQAREAGLLDG